MKKGFGGLIVLLIGIVLLSNTTGFLSWNVWNLLWRFWPLFIVIAGLQMLDVSPKVKNIIAVVIVIIVIGIIVTTMRVTTPKIQDNEELNPESFMVIPTSYQSTHITPKVLGRVI
jgi:uncharacterized membrane protein